MWMCKSAGASDFIHNRELTNIRLQPNSYIFQMTSCDYHRIPHISVQLLSQTLKQDTGHNNSFKT